MSSLFKRIVKRAGKGSKKAMEILKTIDPELAEIIENTAKRKGVDPDKLYAQLSREAIREKIMGTPEGERRRTKKERQPKTVLEEIQSLATNLSSTMKALKELRDTLNQIFPEQQNIVTSSNEEGIVIKIRSLEDLEELRKKLGIQTPTTTYTPLKYEGAAPWWLHPEATLAFSRLANELTTAIVEGVKQAIGGTKASLPKPPSIEEVLGGKNA